MPLRFDLGPAAARPLAPIGAAITGQPAAGTTVARRLGALSERYESGGRGPGTVSSGKGDPGGVSYGQFQFATRTGTVATFLQAEGAPWLADFAGKAPGSPPFSEAWQQVARRDADVFAEAQRAFIERTHYRPAVAAVLARTGLDLDSRAAPVRDACWSCAVQHGAAARLLAEAVAETDRATARGAAGYDRALLAAIYSQRTAYVRALAQRAAPAERATLLAVAHRRYPDELAAALAMLGG